MTTTNCGDTCGLIDFTMAVAGDRLLPEERMKLAIEAVTSGKMSQRAAGAKYGVTHAGIGKAIKRLETSFHPAKTQSQPVVSGKPEDSAKTGKLPPAEIRSRLRKLCRENNAPSGVAQNSRNGITAKEARGWLKWAGISIPPELDGKTTSFNPATARADKPSSSPSSHDTNEQGLPANDPFSEDTERTAEAGVSEDSDPILDERIDLNKLSQQVLSDVLKSDRSESFKRAATLATELEQLICLAFYGKDGWSGQDWVHINGQLKTCKSLTGQRAEEAHCEVFHGVDSESRAYAI